MLTPVRIDTPHVRVEEHIGAGPGILLGEAKGPKEVLDQGTHIVDRNPDGDLFRNLVVADHVGSGAAGTESEGGIVDLLRCDELEESGGTLTGLGDAPANRRGRYRRGL